MQLGIDYENDEARNIATKLKAGDLVVVWMDIGGDWINLFGPVANVGNWSFSIGPYVVDMDQLSIIRLISIK